MRNRKNEEIIDDLEQPKQKFDLVVTKRHPRTGEIISHSPYILRVVGEIGSSEKMRLWERPAGSGNLFDKDNNPIGRWVTEEKVVRGKTVKEGKFVEGAAHIEWTPPMTKDQKIAKENATLKAEIAALKAERGAKSETTATTKKDKGA